MFNSKMPNELVTKEITISWLVGVVLSGVCLILQVVLYVRIPASRKVDLKILTQITVARLIHVVLEFVIMEDLIIDDWTRFIAFMVYGTSDCALITWMFLFSKNLYDKVIQVFTTKKVTFVLKSVLVWVLALPIGVLFPTLLHYELIYYFGVWCKVYSSLKFAVLVVNLFFFCRIFYVAMKRKLSGNVKGVVRTCVISFILVSISSVQVLLTDLLSFFDQNLVGVVFSVINSYQVLAVMIVFANLVRGFSGMSLHKAISRTMNSTISA